MKKIEQTLDKQVKYIPHGYHIMREKKQVLSMTCT